MSDIKKNVTETISGHPYLALAAGGAVVAAAGSFLAIRQRMKLDRLEAVTSDEIEEEIAAGAIAY